MHLVTKTIKGHEYYYLVEKVRRGARVCTARTVYVGDRRKLADLVQGSVSETMPSSFAPQSVGAQLALAAIAADLGIEALVDQVCPVRAGAPPVGRRLLLASIHRVVAARRDNGLSRLQEFYTGSVLEDLLPIAPSALDDRRLGEMLADLSPAAIDRIESAIVERLIAHEEIQTASLAFDCTNFDSYAGAGTRSRLLQRGHPKSGKPLRVLGLGLLATADEGIPLLTFVYPGNENDVTAFGRFLKALDRREASLDLPLEATVAADGGNISKKILRRMEQRPRYYVLRLPPRHLGDLVRCSRQDLPALEGPLAGKVWAQRLECLVYGESRIVVDVYSRRMHKRQVPGLRRDRNRARADLMELQRLLERQRQGLRRNKPLTVRSVRLRVKKALCREHMASLFRVQVTEGERAPLLTFEEPPEAWAHLDQYILGRTLLVTNQKEWTAEQVVQASRIQSHNERDYRDLKAPEGPTMSPLRHGKDPSLRALALCVSIGMILAKVLQRRVKRAGVHAPSLASVLGPLKQVQRAKIQFKPDAPPALRALAASTWVPSHRTSRQQEILSALKLGNRPELGTTLPEKLSPKNTAIRSNSRQQPGNSR